MKVQGVVLCLSFVFVAVFGFVRRDAPAQDSLTTSKQTLEKIKEQLAAVVNSKDSKEALEAMKKVVGEATTSFNALSANLQDSVDKVVDPEIKKKMVNIRTEVQGQIAKLNEEIAKANPALGDLKDKLDTSFSKIYSASEEAAKSVEPQLAEIKKKLETLGTDFIDVVSSVARTVNDRVKEAMKS